MAGVLLVLGAVALKEHVEKKKAAKKMVYDARYQELQAETERRLSLGRTESGESGVASHVIENSRSEGEEEEEMPPPSYEQVVRSHSGRTMEGGMLEKKQSRRRSGIRKLMRLG